jgi:hypothetical protein
MRSRRLQQSGRARPPARVAWVAMLVCLALCGAAAAQSEGNGTGEKRTFANIKSARIERFPNAVRITLTADGTLDARPDFEAFLTAVHFLPNGGADMDPISRVSFYIDNGRSSVGSFVDVATYPVSHIALSPLSTGNLGIGLRCELVLYRPAGTLRFFDIDGWGADYWTYVQKAAITYTIRRSNDMRSIVITVMSDQYDDPAKQVVREPRQGDASYLRIGGSDGVFSVEAVNVPVTRLLQVLGEKSGRTVAISALSRERWTTLSLPPTPIDEIVRTVCDGYELSWLPRDEGGYTISEARAADLPSYAAGRTELVVCRNIAAETAINLLPRLILPYVRVDVERNGVVVNGPPALIAKVRQDLAVLDQPPPLVEIEALALTVLSQEARDRIWRWGGAGSDGGGSIGAGSVTYGSGALLADDDGSGMVMVPRPTPAGGWLTELHAVSAGDQIRLLARPRVRVINGHSGRLFVGEERYVVMQATRQSEGGLTPVPLGVSFEVTPLVGDGNDITVEIAASVSSALEAGGAEGVSAARRTLSGSSRIRDGDTVLVGGLLTEEAARDRSAPQALVDLPGLGDLFGTRRRGEKLEDVCFLLTARIVRDPSVSADDTASKVLLEGEAQGNATPTAPADSGYVAHGALSIAR